MALHPRTRAVNIGQNIATGHQAQRPDWPWRRQLSWERRCLLLTAILVPLALLGGAVAGSDALPRTIGTMSRAGDDHMATVTEVERTLKGPARRWSGQVVLVRARAVRSLRWQAPDSVVSSVALVDPAASSSMSSLSVTWGAPDPLLSTLRRLPILRSLVPAAQRLHLGTVAVYRVQLEVALDPGPGSADAVLLDADPNSL